MRWRYKKPFGKIELLMKKHKGSGSINSLLPALKAPNRMAPVWELHFKLRREAEN